MKTIKFTLLPIFILFSTFASAQTSSVNWLNGGRITNETLPNKVIEKDANGFCVYNYKVMSFLQSSIPAPILERYSYPDCNLLYSVDLGKDTKGKKVKLGFVDLLTMKDKIILIQKDDKDVYAQAININDGSLSDQKVKIGSFPNDKEYKDLSGGAGMYAVSADGSTFSVSFIDTAMKKISITAFSSDLTQKWAKTISQPFQTSWFYPIDSHLSADGNKVYLVAGVIYDKLPPNEKHGTNYYILSSGSTSDEITKYKIDMGDELLSSFAMTTGKTGDIVCAGFYSKISTATDIFGIKGNNMGIPISFTSAMGSFMMRIDATTKQVSIKKTPFEHNFLLHYMDEKDIAHGDEVSNLTTDNIFVLDDNSVIISAEIRRCGVDAFIASSFSYQQVSGYFNDVVVVKFNPDGTIGLFKNIAKKQYTDRFARRCSYAFFSNGNYAYVAYNDNKKNLDLKPEIIAKENDADIKTASLNYREVGARNVLILAKINMKTGSVERTCLNGPKDSYGMLFCPAMTVQYTPNSFIMYHENGDNYEFGEVKF